MSIRNSVVHFFKTLTLHAYASDNCSALCLESYISSWFPSLIHRGNRFWVFCTVLRIGMFLEWDRRCGITCRNAEPRSKLQRQPILSILQGVQDWDVSRMRQEARHNLQECGAQKQTCLTKQRWTGNQVVMLAWRDFYQKTVACVWVAPEGFDVPCMWQSTSDWAKGGT